jgi:N-methylhydantoinase A
MITARAALRRRPLSSTAGATTARARSDISTALEARVGTADAATSRRHSGGYRVGIDTGGTFTDVVVGDETGILSVGKALTTRERISRGILEGLQIAAVPLGIDAGTLLDQTAVFIYGSTRATNAILEGKTARTALLVTEGFPDTLVRREGGKTNPWDYSKDYPEPYVPRHLTFEIRERMTAEGQVLVPFDEAAMAAVLERLRSQRVEAVAVCFLWSIANPAHELAVGRLLERKLPGIPYTLSHQVNPIVREYRRASSAAIDASLKPLMQQHLREMETDLRAAGLRGELLPAISLGGVMHIDGVIAKPIHMVRSGPSLAPILGQVTGAAEVGATEVIVCDTGGTSFDVSLVRDGRPVFGRDTWLGARYTGHLTGLSSVDARSIGSGGGSIARIDSGGLLCVGPESAGADPGPACYGRGGTLPTVTDAAAVLGYLDAEYFNGGRMRLDLGAARNAVGRLAKELGKTLEDTASGILTVASEHMVAAIKEITINEGVDPRDSLLLAGGGAAGLNIVPIARELGCKQVLLPRMAGALSACGAQYTDVVTEFGTSQLTQSNDFDYPGVNRALKGLSDSIEAFKSNLRARGIDRFRAEYFVEARYLYQVWELEVPLPGPALDGPEDVKRIVEAFHAVHESIFAVSEAEQQIEFIHWKGRVTGELDRPPLTPAPAGAAPAPTPVRVAPAYFASTGTVEIPLYRGETLGPGARIPGPALIVEPTTTIVLYPGSSAAVTPFNNYMVDVPS